MISGTPTDADAKASQPITVTVSATDGSTPASQPFDLTVTDINNAPVFTSTAVTSATQDAAYTYQRHRQRRRMPATRSPSRSGALPGWLTLTDNGNGTATLSGTPTNADVGSGSVIRPDRDRRRRDRPTRPSPLTVTNVNDAPDRASGGHPVPGHRRHRARSTSAIRTRVTPSPTPSPRQSALSGNATVDSNGLVTYDATGATAGTDARRSL